MDAECLVTDHTQVNRVPETRRELTAPAALCPRHAASGGPRLCPDRQPSRAPDERQKLEEMFRAENLEKSESTNQFKRSHVRRRASARKRKIPRGGNDARNVYDFPEAATTQVYRLRGLVKRSKGKHNTRAHHGKISGFRRSYESATKLLERERNHIRTTGRRVSGSPGSRSRGAFEIPAEDGFRYGTFTIDAFSCAPTFPGTFAGAYGCCSPRGCEQRPHVTAVPARGLSTVFASAEVAWERGVS